MTRTPPFLTPVHGGLVLVVDDVPANRFLYRALLEDHGFAVQEAGSGEEALAAFGRTVTQPPELVLLDVSMPGISGLEVLKRLRERSDGGPAVLVLTAAARDPEDIERGLELGADAYLTKPVPNRELVARVRAQLQIFRLRRELRALRRDQTAMLVHDLRHPLANLAMLAEVLEGDEMNREERLHAAATIRRMVDDLGRLVDTILTASRLESGVFTVAPKLVALADVLDPSIAVFRPLAQRRRVRLEVEAPATASVLADKQRLRQVLDNLLSNAVKFTPRGGVVRLTVTVDPDTAVFRVSDSGPGVAPDERGIIFDRYRQGARGRTKGGAGLGLAIARGVVEAHGGTIRCEDDALGGASFVFTLPRKAAPAGG